MLTSLKIRKQKTTASKTKPDQVVDPLIRNGGTREKSLVPHFSFLASDDESTNHDDEPCSRQDQQNWKCNDEEEQENHRQKEIGDVMHGLVTSLHLLVRAGFL